MERRKQASHMAKTVKSLEQLKKSLYLNKTEINRLFGCGKKSADKCFQAAQKIDCRELKDNYFDETKVRTSSVMRVLGITEAEKEQI